MNFESDHFVPKWKKYVGSNEFGSLSTANSYPFVHDLMTLSISDMEKIENFKKNHRYRPKQIQLSEDQKREIGFRNEIDKLHAMRFEKDDGIENYI